MHIDLFTDILRWWSVAPAMIAIVEIWAALPVLYAAHRVQAPVPMTDLPRAFCTALALFAMCLAIMLAGAIIPLFTKGRLFGLGPDYWGYLYGMAGAWMLWAVASWTLAASFACRRGLIMVTALIWLLAVCVALDVFPVLDQ